MKLLQARAAAILQAQRGAPPPDTPMSIAKAIAESWREREKTSIILDTGYSGTNIITSRDADRAGLERLGPSSKLILDANEGISQASDKTQVHRPGLPPEASNGIITPRVQHSLTSGTAFDDQGLIIIFHPHFEGVTMHRQEDVDIRYTGKPVVTGYRERTGHRFWRVPITAPTSATQPPRKLSTVERLMLSKSPIISSDVVEQATQIAHNVYELPSIEQGIQWIYAACGYPVQSTWIKAIQNENYAGWPLLTA